MSRYMKNKFDFYGIKSLDRKEIFGSFLPDFLTASRHGHLEEIMLLLWDQPEREYQYCALELLYRARKYWTIDTIDLIERLILSKSWWDTVDMLATRCAGHWLSTYPTLRYDRVRSWIDHPDFWLNRSAIIHQLHYKAATDVNLLLQCIQPHTQSQEFFLRKAIGWALRQYSRTDPDQVLAIVERVPMSVLSRKEAVRLIG